MMTVIVKMGGKQYAFVKGADTSVEPRCKDLDESDKMTLDDLDDFAEQGLRTLVYAYKEMPDMTEAQIENLTVEEVESDLTMLGVTGVEDLLQNDVKECIVDFKQAGCKVWILTGDKGATANQIGLSCGVLSPVRQVFQIDEIGPKADTSEWKGKDILISGQVITQLLEDKANKVNCYMDELLDTEGLVVYRSSPSQKADIVRYVKNARNSEITLAIGDGANDVNMIESAHVGIGIMGKEGNQAASFADFAINQFSDLRRLMFWHGNNWVAKITLFTLLIISKTSVFGLSNVFFNTTSTFAGTNFVTDSLFAVFSINVTWYGFYNWFEQVVSFRRYKNREQDCKFKLADHYAWHRDFSAKHWLRNFFMFMVLAYYSANVAFMLPFYSYGGVAHQDGKMMDMWAVGLLVYVLCVWYTHAIFLMFVRDFNVAIILFGLSVYVQWMLVTTGVSFVMKSDPLWKAGGEVIFDVHFWGTFVVALTLMILPLFVVRKTWSLIIFDKFNYS